MMRTSLCVAALAACLFACSEQGTEPGTSSGLLHPISDGRLVAGGEPFARVTTPGSPLVEYALLGDRDAEAIARGEVTTLRPLAVADRKCAGLRTDVELAQHATDGELAVFRAEIVALDAALAELPAEGQWAFAVAVVGEDTILRRVPVETFPELFVDGPVYQEVPDMVCTCDGYGFCEDVKWDDFHGCMDFCWGACKFRFTNAY